MQTVHCADCDLDIPDNVECRLIHLVESHPEVYATEVLPSYHDRMARLNQEDVPRFPTRSPAVDLFKMDDPGDGEGL